MAFHGHSISYWHYKKKKKRMAIYYGEQLFK